MAGLASLHSPQRSPGRGRHPAVQMAALSSSASGHAARTCVMTAALLSDATPSNASEETVTELATAAPIAVGVTSIWMTTGTPMVTVPSWHVTVPDACRQLPAVELAAAKLMPAGRTSITRVAGAASGPSLVTVAV